MRFLPLYVLCAGFLFINPTSAQRNEQADTAKPVPDINLVITADGQPLDERKGIPVSTQKLDFAASLSAESQSRFPNLKPQAVIQSATVSLARGTRRLGSITWEPGQSLAPVASDVLPGDRYVIEFDLAVQRSDGKRLTLPGRQIYAIALY